MSSAVGGGVVWAEKRTIVAIPSNARRMQFSLLGQMAAGSYVGDRRKLGEANRAGQPDRGGDHRRVLRQEACPREQPEERADEERVEELREEELRRSLARELGAAEVVPE